MKKYTKKDIREILEIIALTAIGGVVVLHLNSFVGNAIDDMTGKKEKTETNAKSDSITAPMDTVANINKAKNIYFSDLHSRAK